MNGKTRKDLRQGMVDEFNNKKEPSVMLLNPKAGGAGLNIHGANHVFHYTLEWNPAQIAQATARSYRRGQKLPVFEYKLYYPNTIDQAVLDKLEQKTIVGDKIIEENENLNINQLFQKTLSYKRY